MKDEIKEILDEIKIKSNVNLEWFWRKKNTQNNIKKYLESKGE